jgi:hypothetical protein
MSFSEQIAEFVILWGMLQDVQLNDQHDRITWRWTATGVGLHGALTEVYL